MTKYYDIDTSVRINGGLTINGDTSIPSSFNLYLGGGNITVTGNIIATSNISGNHTGTGSSLTVNGTTSNGGVNPISNGWAYTHENKIGSQGHIPTGGSTTTFLRGDNTWVIPTDTNTYVTGLSSTAGGNGTLTVTRNTGGNLTIDLSHNHDTSYLKLAGGTLTGNTNVTANMNADRYYQNANGSPTSNLGSPSVTEMALFDSQFTNKTWFFDPTKLTFEYTNDGTTWVDVTPSTTTIANFVSGLNNTTINIPNACQQFRINIQNDGNYVYLNALYMYFSTQSHQTQVKIDKLNSQTQVWSSHTSATNKVSSWPGHLYLPFSTIPFSNSISSSSYYSSIRIIFTPTWSSDPTYGTYPIALNGMEVWGGYPAGKRTIYSWDSSKNVTFPNAVTATTFIGSGTSLTVSGTPTNGNTNPINSGWAYTHTNTTGIGSHVPTGGTTSTFLRGDGAWITPTDTNNYDTGISSTSGGNGTLTISRNGLTNLTLDLTHNHDSSYYTKTQIDTSLSGKDFYGKWTLNANGSAYAVNSSGNITITGNGATSVTMSNGTVTISSTDNNTWRPIDTTPTNGDTTNSISSDWAYSHVNSFGIGAHVPSGGDSTTFLRGDSTWITPVDTYVSGISSTSGGNGTLTVSRNNGSNLTLDLSHNHNSLYLGINSTAVNSTLFNNLSSNQFVRNDSPTTMSTGLLFNNTATGGVLASTPTALSYGVLQSYGTLNILADTDASHTEYLYLSAGYPTGANTNGLAIGYTTLTWKGNTVWHSGNMGSGSNLDADKLDGHDSTYYVYKGQYNLFDNMSGGATYDQVDFNTLGIIGEYRFINLGGSGTVNKPASESGMGYYFGMGGGDVGSRGFQLLGTSNKNLYFRDLSNNVWCKTWNDQNMGAGSGLNSDMVDSIQGSQLVRNDLANQTVDTGFTMSSNAYVGMSNGSGALYVRTGAGAVGIQLAGDNSSPQSGVGSYLNANGTATFTGTMTANAIAVSSTSLVANLNATMINSVKEPQLAKNTSISEISGKGVYTGLSVQAQSVPNMTVQINIGTAYTDSGMRVTIGTATSVSFSAPSATYNRIDTVYMQGSSAGANEGVITVMTGTAQSSPVPPTIPSDAIQLANVTVRQNAGSILSTDITDMRLWKPFYNSSGDTYVRNNLYIQGSLNSTNGFISLSQPIKNTAPNNSVTISAGSTSYTWTHNLNLARYVVRLSWNNLEPHVTWSNKTTNAITINLDNAYDTDTIVDISIEAF